MRAIRYHGREDLRLEELPEREPGPGEVALRVHANGVCGSDLHEYYHGPRWTTTAPHALTGQQLPVVPPGVDRLQAALAEPLAVALRAARRTHAEAGDVVTVHGAGPIGIGALLALKARGVRVLVSDPSPMRRRVAAGLGAELVIDPSSDDPVAAARDLTGGVGAAGAVDAAGVPGALRAAVASTRADGTVVVVAHHHDGGLPLTSGHLIFNEVHVTGSAMYTDEFPLVLAGMAAGHYPMTGWVTTVAMDRIVEDAIEPLARQEALKILVEVN